MRKALLIGAFVVGIVGLFASVLAPEGAAVIELVAPRQPAPGEAAEVQVTTGSLPAGARLVLTTEDGEVLGAVFPFGLPRAPITATVPIPPSAIVGGRLRLRLQVEEPGKQPRPPRAEEAKEKDLQLVIKPSK